MVFPWKIVKKTHTPSDDLIEKIKEILYPPLLTETKFEEGKRVKYHVDHSIDTNLSAALDDLLEGNNDSVAQNTINKSIHKLLVVRKLLEAYAKIDEEAEYIIVENEKDEYKDEAASLIA